MKEPLVSVIIPVYKVEKYLDKCVNSVINQTYRNLEIILVDDGSPDNCPAMCDEWAKKDCRIKVIHKKNGGSAKARNVALDIAKGEYIAFIDSDDMMNYDMISTLFNVAFEQNADIVECDYSTSEQVLNNNFEIGQIVIADSKKAILENIRDAMFKQVIWNKLYKTSIIGKIRFVEGKVIDDEFWTYRVVGNATKLVHIQKELYFYRQQNESVMHQQYSLKRLAGVEAHIERHKYIAINFPEILEQSLIQLWFDCRYHGQMALLYLNNEEKVEAFDYLRTLLIQHPLSYRIVLCQEPKEVLWLMIEKISLKLVCKLRNIMRKGL